MSEEIKEQCCCGHDHEHHHHHHDHDEECCCGHDHEHHHHHHEHDEDCCCGHDHEHHHHHHHEHDEECCCGHDHEHHHHHHHDHDEECCCGHDHEHHHHHDNVEMSTHENATIATVKMELGSDRNLAAVLLRSFMRAVAEDAEAAGGMVGHIKFFLKVAAGEMFSMTDLDEIQVKPAEGKSVSAEGVVIVVNIDPEKLHDIVTLHYPTAI